jgi:Zn-dependent protease with chaperone function
MWFVSATLMLWASATVERRLKKQRWPLSAYLGEGLRWFGMLSFGFIILVTAQVLVGSWLGQAVGLLTGTVGFVAFNELAPRFIPWFWRAQPLPVGVLRRSIERMAVEAGVNLSEIWVMGDPLDGATNAVAIGGFLTRPCVMLSARLLSGLNQAEAAAVAAHELGHIQCGHLYKRSLLYFAALFIFVWGTSAATDFFKGNGWAAWGTMLGGFLLFLYGLTYFYRRDEFNADAAAARLTKKPLVVVKALEKIHDIAWLPTEWAKRQGLRLSHPSLGSRLARLKLFAQQSKAL